MRECHSEVEQEHEGWLCVAQEMFRKSTDVLRRIIAPVDEMGGVTFCMCVLIVTASRLRTTKGGFVPCMERGNAAGGARLVAASTSGNP